MLRYALYTLLLLTTSIGSPAQNISRNIPIAARLLSTDESGNAYAVRTDNVLVRYNVAGDSTGFYSGLLNGDIGSVDAMNPLRIFLYYPSFSKIILLDQTLNVQSETDLGRLNVPSGAIAAPSSDNKIWVYDSYSATLRKIDENGEVIRSSNDLRQQLDFVPQGAFLAERDRRVYLADSSRGVLIFDQFGSYLSLLPITGISSLQVVGDDIIYPHGNTLRSYNMKSSGEQRKNLPAITGDTILDVKICAHSLLVLSKKMLGFYKWPL